MGLYEDLKAIEPFSLSCHNDPDGLYSATMLRRIFKVKEPIELPPFNEYKTDVAVDLGFPSDIEWSGIVVDHHPDHPEERKYKLYWDYCPTGLILYKHLREHIKKEDMWLVVGSLMGDGQPELTPEEVWKSNPVLLKGRGYLYPGQWGKLSLSATPLYIFLSSGVNSLCRLGFPQEALNVLGNMTDPVQLLENEVVRDASETMRKEEKAVYDQRPLVETFGNYTLVRIKTSKPQIKLCGLIASKLLGQDGTNTFIVLNEISGEISLRGNLAKYYAIKMSNAGFKAGGHAKYCGAHIELKDIDKFVEFVRLMDDI